MATKGTWTRLGSIATPFKSNLKQISGSDIRADRAGDSVYSTWRWKKLSLKVRSKGKYKGCSRCGAKDVPLQVNHIYPLFMMGDNPETNPMCWDLRNLEVICAVCHPKVTREDRIKYGATGKTSVMSGLAAKLDWLEADGGETTQGGTSGI